MTVVYRQNQKQRHTDRQTEKHIITQTDKQTNLQVSLKVYAIGRSDGIVGVNQHCSTVVVARVFRTIRAVHQGQLVRIIVRLSR